MSRYEEIIDKAKAILEDNHEVHSNSRVAMGVMQNVKSYVNEEETFKLVSYTYKNSNTKSEKENFEITKIDNSNPVICQSRDIDETEFNTYRTHGEIHHIKDDIFNTYENLLFSNKITSVDKVEYILDKLVSSEITIEEAKKKLYKIGARGIITKDEIIMNGCWANHEHACECYYKCEVHEKYLNETENEN
jgi:hypothetical protein